MSSHIPAHLITQWSKLPPSKIPAAVAKTGLRISRKKAAISARLERLRTGPGSKKLPNDVTGLKLEFAFRNTHMGARHFWKEDLPSIAYTNPLLQIEINRPKEKEAFDPTITLEFADSSKRQLLLNNKHSSAILSELFTLASASKSSLDPSPFPARPSSKSSPSSTVNPETSEPVPTYPPSNVSASKEPASTGDKVPPTSALDTPAA